eukprot:1196206-Prorocentrum_minimum.AAC.4
MLHKTIKESHANKGALSELLRQIRRLNCNRRKTLHLKRSPIRPSCRQTWQLTRQAPANIPPIALSKNSGNFNQQGRLLVHAGVYTQICRVCVRINARLRTERLPNSGHRGKGADTVIRPGDNT